jgi:hypothetical protein
VLADGEQVFLWPNMAQRLALADTGVDGLFPPPAARTDAVAPRDRVTVPELVDELVADRVPEMGIFRVWTPRGRPPALAADQLPLTVEARASLAEYDALTDDPALRCEPPGMPVMLDTPYPVAFIDQGDRILVRYEEWDAQRTIWMRAGGGPELQEHALRGISFGRWEGESLAVFTLYIDYPYFDDLGTPQSRDVTVLERYRPGADWSRLDWEVTVTDAASFTESVTRIGYYAWEPGEAIKPFECTLISD